MSRDAATSSMEAPDDRGGVSVADDRSLLVDDTGARTLVDGREISDDSDGSDDSDFGDVGKDEVAPADASARPGLPGWVRYAGWSLFGLQLLVMFAFSECRSG
jgi:hypothetical protein